MGRRQVPLFVCALAVGAAVGLMFPHVAPGLESAINPLLMLMQVLLLPVYLFLFVGQELIATIDVRPFAEAFLLLIALPLTLAVVTQFLARRYTAAVTFGRAIEALMVPAMMLTLAVVVASQIGAVRSDLVLLIGVVPLYAAYLIVAPLLGWATARAFRQDVPGTRAMIFSGATRNSLVVLPLALALPEPLALVAVVVVTQTLVELIGMVVYVRAVPRLIREIRPRRQIDNAEQTRPL